MGNCRRGGHKQWNHAIWAMLGRFPQPLHRICLFARYRLGIASLRLLHVLALQEENRTLLRPRHQGEQHLQLLSRRCPSSISLSTPSISMLAACSSRFVLACQAAGSCFVISFRQRTRLRTCLTAYSTWSAARCQALPFHGQFSFSFSILIVTARFDRRHRCGVHYRDTLYLSSSQPSPSC